MRVARKECRGRHDLARLTVTALRYLAIDPGVLDPGARRSRTNPLDRRDRRAADAVDRSDARPCGRAIDMDRAGPAPRHAAAELRSGHAEHVPQYPQQRRVAVDIDAQLAAVNLDDEGHGLLSL